MKTRKFKVKNGIGGTWVTLQGTTKHEVQTTRDRENRETLKSIVTVCAIGSKLSYPPKRKNAFTAGELFKGGESLIITLPINSLKQR
ncbi:MAG: hypothetical protein U0K24_11845 [Lachnospiraceae bacterium]|nr:hypothetical protein [Lachnospiraceae bacterium]